MDREIILMRHGQPALVAGKKVSARDMQGWIDGYDRAGITDQPVPAASLQLATRARVIVSSTAPRALSSLQALGLAPSHVDALFVKRSCRLANGGYLDFHRLPGHSFFACCGCAVTRAMSKPSALPGSVPASQRNGYCHLPARGR